jgi:hypothetical protein
MLGVSERSNLLCIFVIFVPGHIGVRGNDRGDKLAGIATISDGRVMNHAYVLHALCEPGRVEDSLVDSYLDTTEKQRDGQVNLGAARYEHYAGSQRRMVNQMRTGTLSHQTFFECTQEMIGAIIGISRVQG